jgi:hypothetical protein
MAKLAENWQPAGTKRLYLGLGPRSTRGDIEWTCRYLFSEALLAVAPHVVAELFLTEMAAELSSPGAPAERFVTDPAAWCRKYRLTFGGQPCGWLLHAAMVAQGLKQHAPAGLPVWPVVARSGSRRDALPASALVVAIDWDPFGSATQSDAYRRARAAVKRKLDIAADLARQAGRVRTPIKRQPEHFEWAVRFQVCGESIPSIAGDLEERSAQMAIAEVLKRVGIDRRIAPSGRVKNTKAQEEKRLRVPS